MLGAHARVRAGRGSTVVLLVSGIWDEKALGGAGGPCQEPGPGVLRLFDLRVGVGGSGSFPAMCFRRLKISITRFLIHKDALKISITHFFFFITHFLITQRCIWYNTMNHKY